MRARIHRGAHEVGGNCVELEAQGRRIILDLGLPLATPLDADVPLPAVPGLQDGDDPSLLGVLLSHPHLDHYGLVNKIAPAVPVYLGEAASKIIQESVFFTPSGSAIRPSGFFMHKEDMVLGPFRITPYLNDHSAFDAYSLLIEAGGRRLFYTGDIRGHGRKAGVFEELLRQPPPNVEVLLLEGTHIGPDTDGSERGPSESKVVIATTWGRSGGQGPSEIKPVG